MQFWTFLHAHLVCRICEMHQRAILDLAWLTWAFDYNLETCSLVHKRLDRRKKSPRKLVQMNPKEKCLWTIVTIWMKQPIWGWVYVLKSSKIPSEIVVHSHCKDGKRCKKLNSLMVNIYQERNITLIYSFFRHRKHLRQLKTWSRLTTDSSAKTFTVPRVWVKLRWMKDEHTSSKLEITLISRRRGI